MKKQLLSIFAMAMLMAFAAVGYAQTVTYTKITSESELEAGAQYIIVGYDDALGYCAMSYQKASNRHAVQVSENGGSISVAPATDPNSQTEVFQLTLGGSDGAWTFFDELKNGYLYAASSSQNQLKTQTTLDDNGKWAIEFDEDGTAEVVAQGSNTRNYMRFNENSSNGTPLFNCYKSDATIQVPVAFYKAGGSANPDPEPTNYPTNFRASVQGVDITLTWTDAAGGQLPSNYLVIGSEGDIRVPVDGQPVGNDILVANVRYGVQTVSFEGLEGNTTYNFAIFPYTNSGSNINYKTDGSYPTAQATTESVDMLLNEDFDGSLGMFTEYSVEGEKVWQAASYGGVNYAYMNSFISSGVYEVSEDWLISPEIPFGRDYDAINLEFRTATKFDGNAIKVMVSADFVGGEPSDGDWVDVTDRFALSTGNYEWIESGKFNVASVITNQVGFFHVAFVYTSTATAGAAWEIDYVKVTGENSVSVSENAISNVSVYPNPANDVISFNLESDAQVSVFDMTGRIVSTMNMTAGAAQFQVTGFESGVYFLNIRYADGKKAVARFVKF